MWNQGAEIERSVAEQVEGQTGAIVNGSFVALNPGDSLVDACLNLASDAGYEKFRVYLNGAEVEPEDAPEFMEQGDVLKITAYDVAG